MTISTAAKTVSVDQLKDDVRIIHEGAVACVERVDPDGNGGVYAELDSAGDLFHVHFVAGTVLELAA